MLTSKESTGSLPERTDWMEKGLKQDGVTRAKALPIQHITAGGTPASQKEKVKVTRRKAAS